MAKEGLVKYLFWLFFVFLLILLVHPNLSNFKVWKIEKKKSKELLAVKEMAKSKYFSEYIEKIFFLIKNNYKKKRGICHERKKSIKFSSPLVYFISLTKNEKNILNLKKTRFLVNMICAFQDRDNLYLVLEFMKGGDLRYHLMKRKCFTEVESSKQETLST